VKEAKGVGHELKGRRTDALGFPINIGTLHAQYFWAKAGRRRSRKRRSKEALWAMTSTTQPSRSSTA
jgi:hypothetical protein